MKRGLKSYAVCDLLGVPKQTLRYWRINLDPFSTRSEFDGAAILAYRIIKTCINKQGINVKKLKVNGLGLLFEECKKHRSILNDKLFIFNNQNNKIKIINKDDSKINLYSPEFRVFAFEDILDEHIESMISFGTPSSKAKNINQADALSP